MENNEKYLHGRLDPGIESTLQLVEGVESPDSTSFLPSLDAPSPESSHGENAIFTGMSLPLLHCLCLVFLAFWCCIFRLMEMTRSFS